MKVSFRVLASGSNGNASVITTPEGSLLIDDGLSKKRLLALMEKTSVKINDIIGILITHGHTDHIQGLPVLMSTYQNPIYCTRGTQSRFLSKRSQDKRWITLANKMTTIPTNGHFKVGPFEIESLPTVHDVEDSVSYKVTVDGISISAITDTGKITDTHLNAMLGSTIVLLEMNHDIDMLLKSRRPPFLKRRIRACHLANEEALGYLEQLTHSNIKNLFAGHLSGECNSPDQVEDSISSWENKFGEATWKWHICERHKPGKKITISTEHEKKEFRTDLKVKPAKKEVKHSSTTAIKKKQKSIIDFYVKKNS